MAIAHEEVASPPLTYEQYLAEGEINQRYDILDGARCFMTNPTREHQDVQGNVYEEFRAYQRSVRSGRAYQAPCDVLISRNPLRIRQPDVLFISNARLAQNPPASDPAPLEPAPELVVEILSPSDTFSVFEAKLADYYAAGVEECWAIRPQLSTVEVLRLTANGAETGETYGVGETVQSLTFSDLRVEVAAIFAA